MFSIRCTDYVVRNLKLYKQVDLKHFDLNLFPDTIFEVSKISIYISVCFCTELHSKTCLDFHWNKNSPWSYCSSSA